MTEIQLKRVYADPDGSEAQDGWRVLVDRLWPQGESHQRFHYDEWDKGVAPSTELRQWYHAQGRQAAWDEFARRYRQELDGSAAAQALLAQVRQKPKVTLLYGSRDTEHNNAVVLAQWLREHLEAEGGE